MGVYTSREAAVHNAMVAMENIYGMKAFYEDRELIVEEHEDIEDNKDSHCQDAGESCFKHILLCTFSMAKATGSRGLYD